ncbi:unnamed protein product [Rotaria sp. Silwood2]|nr:unnamed protein product [Rotaria sp. Silwood2]CAF4628913.1 unnamed protein product [Rotaria sp. Silwood2]
MDDSSEYDSNNEICSESNNKTSSESDESSRSSKECDNFSDDENSDSTIKWNYNVPKRKLKPFNDQSNILHQYGFKFRPIDAFMLLFTEQLFELICKQTNIYGQQKHDKKWTKLTSLNLKNGSE